MHKRSVILTAQNIAQNGFMRYNYFIRRVTAMKTEGLLGKTGGLFGYERTVNYHESISPPL